MIRPDTQYAELAIWISDLGRGPLYISLAFISIISGALARRFSTSKLSSDLLWLGWRLSAFWVIGIALNLCLKHQINAPRPWWINPELHPLHPHPARGFGMPSGHTQSAVGVWLMCLGLATLLKRHRPDSKWGGAVSRSLIIGWGSAWVVAIAWSRVYLNAHSLAQVIAGALVGLLWSGALIKLERHPRGGVALFAFSGGCALVGAWISSQPIVLPAIWSETILTHHVVPPSAPSLALVLVLSALTLGISLIMFRRAQHEESA